MRRLRLLWQLYPSYLIITLLCVVIVGLYATVSLRSFYRQETTNNLERLARITAFHAGEDVGALPSRGIDSLCKSVGALGDVRITVLRTDGTVLGDSHTPFDSSTERKQLSGDIIEAIATREVVSDRSSDSLHLRQLYVTLPVLRGDQVVGVIRCAISTTQIDDSLNLMYLQLGIGCAGIVILVAVVSLFVARGISRPIELIKRGAERFAAGELENRLPIPNTEEIGGLAEVMNTMASQLHERIRTMTSQRSEQQAILASMIEGVLAIDGDERLININETAGRLFSVEPAAVLGRSIHEVIRNSQLLHLVRRIREERSQAEEQIVLQKDNRSELFLQATGSVLRDDQGNSIGALIVLNDVTRIRNLENVRREFVANVSHELRTPLTSVKGYVETLLDGGIESPHDRERFLLVISRQVDRLTAIIEDLLSLSRIEMQTERAEIQLLSESLVEPIRRSIESCRPTALEKQIELSWECDPQLVGMINSSLLEQALVNLIDNAIKYGREKMQVRVGAQLHDGRIHLSVQDAGPGIAEEHLARIFERFYRIDKGRGREKGGTGLGLAIVKHIALAHGGTVEVESQVGFGSRFTIILPGQQGNPSLIRA